MSAVATGTEEKYPRLYGGGNLMYVQVAPTIFASTFFPWVVIWKDEERDMWVAERWGPDPNFTLGWDELIIGEADIAEAPHLKEVFLKVQAYVMKNLVSNKQITSVTTMEDWKHWS